MSAVIIEFPDFRSFDQMSDKDKRKVKRSKWLVEGSTDRQLLAAMDGDFGGWNDELKDARLQDIIDELDKRRIMPE